ncbi:TLR adapter interacting with SLC15A4 on the lysosome-like [Anomaloglossus baeobatrachus]|uniref:TLR adapter interacting with SLC15A4 on the lysosome-like n=1 Tax=Anomaloglossus baeobatrachus TaxID=238106 RepID=UPI003F509B6C
MTIAVVAMLSESFLCTAIYRDLLNIEEQKDGGKENSLAECSGISASDYRNCGMDPQRPAESSVTPSQALNIPKREAVIAGSLDLYTSWSSPYGSIYKNYPDLHIAGDHILHKADSGCILDTDCEDGPVLLSADIDSSSPPGDNSGGLLEGKGPPSVESQISPSAPFSNSVLNGFIEKKMQEVYKQCYEETLSTGTSPHPHMWSAILHNMHQISLQISQEHNLQGPCCTTSGGSSEFITPVLHISGQDSKTKPGALGSNWARVHSKK